MQIIIDSDNISPNKQTLKQSFVYGCMVLVTGLFSSSASFATEACADFLSGQSRLLHSSKTIDLCKSFANKPLLVVNTASHCGFTGQFKGLEALHQQYKDKGLVVVGVPSNDFKQAASSEEKAAGVCFENYGVSFTMLAPSRVIGESASTLFKGINQQSEPPAWNFTKYLMNEKGQVVKRFASSVAPESKAVSDAIDQLLTKP